MLATGYPGRHDKPHFYNLDDQNSRSIYPYIPMPPRDSGLTRRQIDSVRSPNLGDSQIARYSSPEFKKAEEELLFAE